MRDLLAAAAVYLLGGVLASRFRAAAGVCLGALLAVLAGLVFLPGAHTAATQTALLAPMAAGVVALLPAAALAEWVARRKGAPGLGKPSPPGDP